MNGVINLKKQKMIFWEEVTTRNYTPGPYWRITLYGAGVRLWKWWWFGLHLQDNNAIERPGKSHRRWVDFMGAGELLYFRFWWGDGAMAESVTQSNLICNMMTRSLCCVLTKVWDIPSYDGLSEVDTFLDKFEREVLEKQCFHALDWVLHAIAARWWITYKEALMTGVNVGEWCTQDLGILGCDWQTNTMDEMIHVHL